MTIYVFDRISLVDMGTAISSARGETLSPSFRDERGGTIYSALLEFLTIARIEDEVTAPLCYLDPVKRSSLSFPSSSSSLSLSFSRMRVFKMVIGYQSGCALDRFQTSKARKLNKAGNTQRRRNAFQDLFFYIYIVVEHLYYFFLSFDSQCPV